MSDEGRSGGLTDCDVGLGGRLLGLLGTDPGDGLLGAGGGLSASAIPIMSILRPQQLKFQILIQILRKIGAGGRFLSFIFLFF